jgi:hypothetical protein
LALKYKTPDEVHRASIELDPQRKRPLRVNLFKDETPGTNARVSKEKIV